MGLGLERFVGSQDNVERNFVVCDAVSSLLLDNFDGVLQKMFLNFRHWDNLKFGFFQQISLGLVEERQFKSNCILFFGFRLESEHFLLFEDVFCDTNQLIAEDDLFADSYCEERSFYGDGLGFEQDGQDELLLVVQFKFLAFED